MLLVDEIFRKAHPEIILSGDYSWFIIKKELPEDVPLKILFTDTNSLRSIFLRFQYFPFPRFFNILITFFIFVIF